MKISIMHDDALQYPADILAVKFAQNLYGVDYAVVKRLFEDYSKVEVSIPENETQIVDSQGKLGAQSVLFVGVTSLYDFQYDQIRAFSYRILETLSAYPQYKHVAMTIHGVGYGLNAEQSLWYEIAGLYDAITAHKCTIHVEEISIVERHSGRFQRLEYILQQILPSGILSQSCKHLSAGYKAIE